jgi:outer membrane protein OmpA-like peptidoglycan-associated protein
MSDDWVSAHFEGQFEARGVGRAVTTRGRGMALRINSLRGFVEEVHESAAPTGEGGLACGEVRDLEVVDGRLRWVASGLRLEDAQLHGFCLRSYVRRGSVLIGKIYGTLYGRVPDAHSRRELLEAQNAAAALRGGRGLSDAGSDSGAGSGAMASGTANASVPKPLLRLVSPDAGASAGAEPAVGAAAGTSRPGARHRATSPEGAEVLPSRWWQEELEEEARASSAQNGARADAAPNCFSTEVASAASKEDPATSGARRFTVVALDEQRKLRERNAARVRLKTWSRLLAWIAVAGAVLGGLWGLWWWAGWWGIGGLAVALLFGASVQFARDGDPGLLQILVVIAAVAFVGYGGYRGINAVASRFRSASTSPDSALLAEARAREQQQAAAAGAAAASLSAAPALLSRVGITLPVTMTLEQALAMPATFDRECLHGVLLTVVSGFGWNTDALGSALDVGLPDAARVLKSRPWAHATILGHTDAVGDERYNQDLSQRRADAVRYWLATDGGINPERLSSQGLSSVRPLSTQPGAGRLNRRAELLVRCAGR